MKRAKEIIEIASNIAVILGFVIAGVVLFFAWQNGQSPTLSVGQTLPALPGHGWAGQPRTLVLALRDGCHYCEQSMPFYRELASLERERRLDAQMVAVFPDSHAEAARVLQSQRLNIPLIAPYNLSRLNVTGTPTLILVDRNGRATGVWIGEQNNAGEQAILGSLQRTPTAQAPRPPYRMCAASQPGCPQSQFLRLSSENRASSFRERPSREAASCAANLRKRGTQE